MIARAVMLCALSFTLAACSEEDAPPRVGSWECGPPEPLYVELSTTHHEMCVGSEQRLSVEVQWSCRNGTTSTGGVFASSDPVVIAIDGDRALARAPGAAELKAKAEGKESPPMVVRVVRCADAGTDAAVASDADATD